MDSILLSVKKLCSLDEDYNDFDDEIIMHINAVLMSLAQMGIGPADYIVTDESQLWSEYTSGRKDLEGIKTYVGYRVRKIFDPPTSGAVMDALQATIDEMESRLFMACNHRDSFK